MPKHLSDDQLERYRQTGFVFPLTALNGEEAFGYRQRFEAYEAANGGWYELSKGQKLYLLQTWVAELASHPRVLDAVEDVLGANLFVWGVSLFVKDARTVDYVSWHQDSTYWGLNQPDVVTAWLALSPATPESGCMKMQPGSHKLNQLPHVDTLAKHNLLTRGQEIAVEVDEKEAQLVALQPGQFSLHHVRTVHASEPNRSGDRRIGVAVRYVAPHVRQVSGQKDTAWLVRGEDRFGNFLHERPPAADMDEAARAEHARIMRIRQEILYKGVRGTPERDRA